MCTGWGCSGVWGQELWNILQNKRRVIGESSIMNVMVLLCEIQRLDLDL